MSVVRTREGSDSVPNITGSRLLETAGRLEDPLDRRKLELEKFGSLEVGESFGTRPFCLDKLPEFTGTPVFLLRDIFAEDQPVTLPSSPLYVCQC